MPLNRRGFLRIAGSTAVILAAGTGAFALTRDPTRASAPWRGAGTDYSDPRMRALSYAILAPNPHNRQPWLVRLDGDDAATLFCDATRRLPETDPFDRQIVIGLGCFLEVLRMAAAADGHELRMTPFPAGEPGDRVDDRPVARLVIDGSRGARPDPLFAQVLRRRSNKEPYDTGRGVGDADLAALRAVVGDGVRVGTDNVAQRVAALRDLTWRAHLAEVRTPRTYLESVRLMRIGKAEIQANPDGIDLGGAFLEGLKLVGLFTRKTVADPSSTAYAEGLRMYREITATAMAYVWLATAGNRRADQLRAGRDWVRVNLRATALGLGIHPLSQALQEYPEVADLNAELRQALGAGDGERVQMLGRLGYGPQVRPSPRWPLVTRVKDA